MRRISSLPVGEDREAVEDGLDLCGRGRKLAERADDVERVYEFLLLEGMGLNQVGECCAGAGELWRKRWGTCRRSMDAQVERGIALFELCRFKEAQASFEQVLKDTPDEAWAHHYLGLLAERRGTRRRREAVREGAGAGAGGVPAAGVPGGAGVRQALEAAVKALPEHVKGYLDNVTISVEDIPSDDELTTSPSPVEYVTERSRLHSKTMAARRCRWRCCAGLPDMAWSAMPTRAAAPWSGHATEATRGQRRRRQRRLDARTAGDLEGALPSGVAQQHHVLVQRRTTPPAHAAEATPRRERP